MASIFNARNAEGYERVMGRWSRRVAPRFIDFAGVRAGDRVLDVGSGTGSLAFALAATGIPSAVTGIDYAEMYVEFARERNTDPRVTFQQADATALPFADASFDRSLSMFVLNFVSDPVRAAGEIRRVTRPGGVMAAAIWDLRGGSPVARLFLDVAATLDPTAGEAVRTEYMTMPVTRPGELIALWRSLGLGEVAETQITVRFDYPDFTDFWGSFQTGEGTMGKYLAAQPPESQARLEAAVRRAYEAGEPDGPRSFATTAWACRGVVP